MKRIVLAILVAMFTFCIASAQNDHLKSKDVKNINATTLSCNKGAEPFSTFLNKFKTSETFRYSRIASTAKLVDPNGTKTGTQAVKEIKSFFSGEVSFETYYNEFEDGEYSMATFGVITADKVVYYSEIDSMCYSLDEVVFTRINGKWYVTKYYLSM
jgi:hypothetical protein